MTGSIRIGTCGYGYYDPPAGWQDDYESKLAAFADPFDLLELNRTFYDLPMVRTAERWREEVDAVDEAFEFTIKAWQALTHPTSSPTWSDVDELTDAQREGFGYLRPNEAVREAWRDTRAVAEAFDAEVVLLQTPPSFDASDDHEADVRGLLSSIDRGSLDLAWEPRGDWADHPDRVGAICDDLDLVHVVDVLRTDAEPASDHPVAYTRLHGLNDDPYDYEYDYDDAELEALADRLLGLATDYERVYCLFNNFAMFENARDLAGRLTGRP